MTRTIIACGYGSGSSSAVAERFGREGFAVVLVARSAARLAGHEDGALLVTNGGLRLDDPRVDGMAVALGAMGLAVANASKQKLVGLLAEKLKPMSVYGGEVMVLSAVRGSAFDDGSATLDAAKIGDAFYELFTSRTVVTKKIG